MCWPVSSLASWFRLTEEIRRARRPRSTGPWLQAGESDLPGDWACQDVGRFAAPALLFPLDGILIYARALRLKRVLEVRDLADAPNVNEPCRSRHSMRAPRSPAPSQGCRDWRHARIVFDGIGERMTLVYVSFMPLFMEEIAYKSIVRWSEECRGVSMETGAYR